MENKPNSVIVLKGSLSGSFFRIWLEFLRPFHKLTGREIEVVASCLRHRFEISKSVNNQEILDKLVMSEDTKREVRNECNISQAHFQVIMTKLKKSKVIDNGKINPKFIPRVEKEADNFQLLLSFELQ